MERLSLFNVDQLTPKHRSHRGTLLKASLLLTCLVLSGVVFYHHFGGIDAESAPTYALDLRPDYPVSTWIHKRGFIWFLGLAAVVAGTFVAFGALYPACVAVTTGIGAAGCALAATAVVTTVIGIVATKRAAVTRHRYHLAQQSMLYMDFVDKSSRKTIDDKLAEFADDEHFDPKAADRILEQVFGKTYKFEGVITEDDYTNRHLFVKHGGAVPVFSFTAPNGMKFHHAMVPGDETTHHRFALVENNGSGKPRRQATPYKSGEHFKKGGIDMQDCAISKPNQQRLTQSDHVKMQQQIKCNDGNLAKTEELGIQIYDATTKETIGAGRVAPFNANGNSRILTHNDCPSGLPSKNCGKKPSKL